MNYHLLGFGEVPLPQYENCGFDPACIARNVALQAQYQEALLRDNWTRDHPGIPYPNYQYDAGGNLVGTSPGTPFAVDSQSAGYVAIQPIIKGPDTKSFPSQSGVPPTSGVVWPEDSSTGPVFQGTVPTGGSSASAQVPATQDQSQSQTDTTVFAGIPIWGWAVLAAGVALFAFGGGRGR